MPPASADSKVPDTTGNGGGGPRGDLLGSSSAEGTDTSSPSEFKALSLVPSEDEACSSRPKPSRAEVVGVMLSLSTGVDGAASVATRLAGLEASGSPPK